jgi:hypothetical protein
MKKISSLISIIVLSMFLTSCGYDGSYRYGCHDPENWYNKECNPPICKATGTCTKDILGFDPSEGGVDE